MFIETDAGKSQDECGIDGRGGGGQTIGRGGCNDLRDPVPSDRGWSGEPGAACGSLKFAAHPANAGRRRRIPYRHLASPLSGLAPAGHYPDGPCRI